MRFVSTDDQPARLRPTMREVVAFGGVAALGSLLLLAPPRPRTVIETVVGVAVMALAIGLVVLSVRRDQRTWLDPAGPWLSFLAFVLIRDDSGGTSSTLTSLLALPILWIALFGVRRDLVVAAGLTVASLGLPILVVGPPRYPVADWHRAVLWSAIALFIAPIVQRVVAELAARSEDLSVAHGQLEAVMRGATLTSIIATDPEGRITSFSRGAEQLLGFSAEEVLATRLHLLDLHVGREVAAAADELATPPGFATLAALGDRQAPSRIWRYRRKDRQELFVRCAITPLRDANGDAVGYLAVAIDSTSAIETQHRLEAAEERWRVVMDHLTDTTILVLDEDMQVDLVSGGGAMRTGFRDAIGRPFAEFSNPGNTATITELVSEAVRGHEGRVEMTSTATGSVHQVFVTPLPQSNHDRETRQALVLAHDVSLARARESDTAAARDEAEALFADSPNPLAVVDRSGVLQRVNAAFATLFERPADELLGLPLPSLSTGSDTSLADHLIELATGDAAPRVQWRLETDDGVKHLVVSSTRFGSDRALLTLVDVSERHEHEQQLAHLADHDPLTGLANRRRFGDELARHVDFGRRYGPRGALLLLDLDHFKEVNDTLGHAAGDELIVSVAGLLKHAVRDTDVVARLGGDEFAILLQETNRAGAERVAQNIVDQVRQHMAALDGSQRDVTVSIGAVVIDDGDRTATDLLADADLTMYDAKDAGRNQYAVLDHQHSDRRVRVV